MNEAHTRASSRIKEPVQQNHDAGWGAQSRVFRFGATPLHQNLNGSESWQVGSGSLVTGEVVSLHESMQPTGVPPNPPHSIAHTELICVREGTLEFRHDGRTERAAAGDVLFVAKGTLHGVCNVGSGPASYFVVALGGDVR